MHLDLEEGIALGGVDPEAVASQVLGVGSGHEAHVEAGLLQPSAVVAADGADADHGVAPHRRHGIGTAPYDGPMDDRLYFRQLLAGRDFAQGDQIARQMVNFVYLVGDRETGEAVVVDPAYDIAGLLDLVAADGMRLVGALVTHYHPDHVGGSMAGFSIEGVRELLDRAPVPVHVQADEREWVTKVTGAGDADLVAHTSGDIVTVGDIPIELIHTPGHTPGSQCFLVDNRLVAGDTLFLEGCGRTDLPGGDPAPALREPHPEAGQGPRRRGAVPGPPLLGRAVGHHGRDPQVELRVPAPHRGRVGGHVRRLTSYLRAMAALCRVAATPCRAIQV